ncbi:hypothetical protein N0Y54_12875 [Nostoc punctiforme UO1]|uniref:WD40 repeat domain-containing protein n=1 Tax=Nostoc punctiforme TaxID=272131 RepID=UPI003099D9E2
MGGIVAKLASKSAEFQNLFLGQFPEQQLKVGNSKKYYETLTDFDFISLKIQYPQFGVETLIRDYYLIDDPEILDRLEEDEKVDYGQVKTLKLIERTLQLSAHILNQDPNQLVGQLWGRLQSFPEPEIQKILADAVQSKSENPRFYPITATLTTPGGNLLRTLTGHKASVNVVAITSDGQTAVSASNDNTLKVWDLWTGGEIFSLTGHQASVNAVAITSDGQTAVSASDDNTLKLWDLQTGKKIFTLSGHKDSVNAVAIAPDGKTAVSVSNSVELWTLKLWDLETGKEISTLRGHKNLVNAVVITPDGQTAVSASSDNTLKLWNLQTGRDFSSLNSYLKLFKLWDLETKREISTLKGHKESVNAVAITPDGQKVVSASDDNTLKVWNLRTGREIFTLVITIQ